MSKTNETSKTMKTSRTKTPSWRETRLGRAFRYLVVPAFFALALLEVDWVRLCALAVMAVWVTWVYWEKTKETEAGTVSEEAAVPGAEARGANKTETEERRRESRLDRTARYISRQLQCRCPDARWDWVRRPGEEELAEGGSWFIRVQGIRPGTWAVVDVGKEGSVQVTLLARALDEENVPEEAAHKAPPSPEPAAPDGEDRTEERAAGAKEPGAEEALREETVRDRTERWYEGGAGETLACLIDDLQVRGCRELLLRADGELCRGPEGRRQTEGRLEGMVPREAFPALEECLKKDGIEVRRHEDGLVLRW